MNKKTPIQKALRQARVALWAGMALLASGAQALQISQLSPQG